MIILPAIDIKNGKPVRLYKGDYGTAEKVADSYMETALSFYKSGAEWIHMVDLDGAKDASQQNRDVFIDVAANTKLKVELGGGIRSLDVAEMYFKAGITRLILGSAAVKNPDFVKNALREYKERIAIGIDAKNGFAATDGWLETSGENYIELAEKMYEYGARYFIFTDIDKDGTLTGPNFKMTDELNKRLAPLGANVIASGGVKNADDIMNLRRTGVYGVICGKSLYSGSLDLADAIASAKE